MKLSRTVRPSLSFPVRADAESKISTGQLAGTNAAAGLLYRFADYFTSLKLHRALSRPSLPLTSS